MPPGWDDDLHCEPRMRTNTKGCNDNNDERTPVTYTVGANITNSEKIGYTPIRRQTWNSAYGGCEFYSTAGDYYCNNQKYPSSMKSGYWQHNLGPINPYGTIIVSPLVAVVETLSVHLFFCNNLSSASNPNCWGGWPASDGEGAINGNSGVNVANAEGPTSGGAWLESSTGFGDWSVTPHGYSSAPNGGTQGTGTGWGNGLPHPLLSNLWLFTDNTGNILPPQIDKTQVRVIFDKHYTGGSGCSN